jgi:predicted transcriptional regulator
MEERVSVSLPPALLMQLRTLAEREERSVAWVIRRLIREALDRRG